MLTAAFLTTAREVCTADAQSALAIYRQLHAECAQSIRNCMQPICQFIESCTSSAECRCAIASKFTAISYRQLHVEMCAANAQLPRGKVRRYRPLDVEGARAGEAQLSPSELMLFLQMHVMDVPAANAQ
jgi:hypothetical protein